MYDNNHATNQKGLFAVFPPELLLMLPREPRINGHYFGRLVVVVLQGVPCLFADKGLRPHYL